MKNIKIKNVDGNFIFFLVVGSILYVLNDVKIVVRIDGKLSV